MRYEVPPRRRSAGTVILAIFLLGFMFLVGLAVVAFGVLVFFRAESRDAEVRAAMQQEIALRHVQEARARAELARGRVDGISQQVAAKAGHVREGAPAAMLEAEPAETAEEKGSIRVANREITIQLDETGKIQVDGTACELPQLKEMLAGAGQGREHAIIVIVKVDKRCLFEPVANVLAVCKELGLPHVRIDLG
jgi:hypothetical protein